MKREVLCYEAFSTRPGKGNPAGVCFDSDNLSDEMMQAIAKEAGYRETCFLVGSDNPKADYGLRYFKPQYEVDLCGHGTIASLIALAERLNWKEDRSLSIETRAGLLECNYKAERKEIVMQQANARFHSFEGSVKDLMNAIELPEEAYDDSYPIVYGNTGLWTLVTPIKKLAYFKQMQPHNDDFQYILKKRPFTSVHLFCQETIYEDCLLHARHFSASGGGSPEDIVTGTANGVLGAYYINYMRPELNEAEFLIEQGQDMGKDGFCRTFAKKEEDGTISVKIAGRGIYSEKRIIEIR